jgi:hypothetical protein
MRNVWWIALATAALAIGDRSARADEPTTKPETPPGAVPVAPAAPAAAMMPSPSEPYGGGCCSSCNSCGSCRGGSEKVHKFFAWLIYVPLDHGKTKCCRGCDSCPPPAWVFFPCETSCRGCATCAAGGAPATMYYAKAAAQPTAETVPQATAPSGQTQSGYTPKASQPATGGQTTYSTYKPAAVAASMPVLEPTQFRKAANSSTATPVR